MQVPCCLLAPRTAAAEAPSPPPTVCWSALWSPAATGQGSPAEQCEGKSVQMETEDNKAIRNG